MQIRKIPSIQLPNTNPKNACFFINTLRASKGRIIESSCESSDGNFYRISWREKMPQSQTRVSLRNEHWPDDLLWAPPNTSDDRLRKPGCGWFPTPDSADWAVQSCRKIPADTSQAAAFDLRPLHIYNLDNGQTHAGWSASKLGQGYLNG